MIRSTLSLLAATFFAVSKFTDIPYGLDICAQASAAQLKIITAIKYVTSDFLSMQASPLVLISDRARLILERFSAWREFYIHLRRVAPRWLNTSGRLPVLKDCDIYGSYWLRQRRLA